MPEPGTIAVDLTCAECGRSPCSRTRSLGRPWSTARSAPSGSSENRS